jgi:uncharacterized protein (DUF2235 family)
MAKRKTGARREAKSIILFSDGTGNSSAKLFKTNVWRMYEAVDLGPAEAGKQNQIAFYDDGVGTSSFRPLALLGGIFGIGLKRNVLQIYSYVCRNYDPNSRPLPGSKIKEPGDHIYGFGFSRGAFTMRLAIAMIADQGIIPYTEGNEEELQRKVEAAYDDFRRSRARRAFQWFRETFGKNYDEERAKARVTERVKRKTGYDRASNYRPIIRFIGVWDTVAAYGGPVVEITRAVDNWFYPLSMPDYKLSKHIRRARHALALDDERDSFWPLLWDEIAEEELRASKLPGFDWIDGKRLRQVWFSGMHADVGGGYPDESLSYVSLLWMITEAQDCDLRTIDSITERYRSLINSYGPIHDSRAGIGAYYRYQPRKIAAWLEPVRLSTLSLRDPEIRDDRKNVRKGLIRQPLIHESAIARIASGTDGYAPIALPDNFVIFPDASRETAPLATTGGPRAKVKAAPRTCPPVLDPKVRRRLAPIAIRQGIATAMESALDFVWRRRIAYFANVLATIVLFGWPWIAGRAPNQFAEGGADPGWILLTASVREWLGKLITFVSAPLPNITRRWTDAWAASPYWFVLFVAIIFALRLRSAALETKLRDRSRSIWHCAIPRIPPASAAQAPQGLGPHVKSDIEEFRNSPRFQRSLQILKWGVLPNVFAILIALLTIWVFLVAATQLALPFVETGTRLCPDGSARPGEFQTSRLCNDAHRTVEAGQDYAITFEITSDWKDGSQATDPRGLSAGDMKWLSGYLGAPFRRVIGARYLQPIAEIRWEADSTRSAGAALQALDVEPVPDEPNLFEARFKARVGGQLYLFSNDAVSLLDLDYFYTSPQGKNEGSANVTVTEAGSK